MTDDVHTNVQTNVQASSAPGSASVGQGQTQGRVVQAHVALDWRDPKHFARRRMPCRVCKNPTFLRDNQGRPCDKTCAEKELAAEIVRKQGAYFADERVQGGGTR
jgi:hypothetical protein